MYIPRQCYHGCSIWTMNVTIWLKAPGLIFGHKSAQLSETFCSLFIFIGTSDIQARKWNWTEWNWYFDFFGDMRDILNVHGIKSRISILNPPSPCSINASNVNILHVHRPLHAALKSNMNLQPIFRSAVAFTLIHPITSSADCAYYIDWLFLCSRHCGVWSRIGRSWFASQWRRRAVNATLNTSRETQQLGLHTLWRW